MIKAFVLSYRGENAGPPYPSNLYADVVYLHEDDRSVPHETVFVGRICWLSPQEIVARVVAAVIAVAPNGVTIQPSEVLLPNYQKGG